MRAHSARFDSVIRGSHTLACRVDVMFDRQVILTGIPVYAGEVTFDRNAAIMARSIIQVPHDPDNSLLPTAISGGPLSPYGYELAVWRGITYDDGTDPELLPLGIFPVQHSAFDADTLLATVECFDRSAQVIDARLEEDYVIAAGTNTGTAIAALIDAGVPGLTYAFQTTTNTLNGNVIPAQSDRWAVAQKMARDISCELFFDGYGRCVLKSEPGVETEAALTISEGEGGTLTALTLDLDREGAYSRVIATGESSSSPAVYRGVATDDDPASPTFYDGPFGRKPKFYSSPFITSNDQAASAAATNLQSSTGIARGLVFEMAPNPALEPGDAALMVRSSLGINELHIIDGFTIGLTAEALMGVG